MTRIQGAMMTVFAGGKWRWLLLGVIVVALAALIALAPVEATMGSGIRIVYLHVALIWTAMLGFVATAVVGTAVVISNRAEWLRLMQTVGWVTFGFFVMGVVVSLIAEQVNWGAILWQEPRNTAVFNGTGVALIVLTLSHLLPWRRVAGLLAMALAVFIVLSLPGAERVFHPTDPIGTSSSSAIQSTFYGAFLLTTLALGLVVWQVRSQRV